MNIPSAEKSRELIAKLLSQTRYWPEIEVEKCEHGMPIVPPEPDDPDDPDDE